MTSKAEKDVLFLTSTQFLNDMVIIKSLFRRALRESREINQILGKISRGFKGRIAKLEKAR